MTERKRAAFLDRDGVLNRLILRDGKYVAPWSVAEFSLYEDAPEAVRRLRKLGFLVFVVTNQPDVARGQLAQEELDRIHEKLRQTLAPDDLAFCPHDDADHCHCRKPKPGMLTDLAARWNVDLARSYIVGDSWRDMEAGRGAGCGTILVERDHPTDATGDVRVANLSAAVDYIQARP